MRAPDSKALFGIAVLMASTGCSSLTTSSSGTATPSPTAIMVDPAAFLGTVQCGQAVGDLHAYVATLVDVTKVPEGGTQTPLASSPPSPCFSPVIFEQQALTKGSPYVSLVPGHEYEARIDGYDTSDLRPRTLGSSIMLDSGGATVPAKWTATCGQPGSPSDAGVRDGGDSGASAIFDAGTGIYGDCRSRLLPDGHATGDLSGPVCVYGTLTIVMRHCTPLEPR